MLRGNGLMTGSFPRRTPDLLTRLRMMGLGIMPRQETPALTPALAARLREMAEAAHREQQEAASSYRSPDGAGNREDQQSGQVTNVKKDAVAAIARGDDAIVSVDDMDAILNNALEQFDLPAAHDQAEIEDAVAAGRDLQDVYDEHPPTQQRRHSFIATARPVDLDDDPVAIARSSSVDARRPATNDRNVNNNDGALVRPTESESTLDAAKLYLHALTESSGEATNAAKAGVDLLSNSKDLINDVTNVTSSYASGNVMGAAVYALKAVKSGSNLAKSAYKVYSATSRAAETFEKTIEADSSHQASSSSRENLTDAPENANGNSNGGNRENHVARTALMPAVAPTHPAAFFVGDQEEGDEADVDAEPIDIGAALADALPVSTNDRRFAILERIARRQVPGATAHDAMEAVSRIASAARNSNFRSDDNGDLRVLAGKLKRELEARLDEDVPSADARSESAARAESEDRKRNMVDRPIAKYGLTSHAIRKACFEEIATPEVRKSPNQSALLKALLQDEIDMRSPADALNIATFIVAMDRGSPSARFRKVADVQRIIDCYNTVDNLLARLPTANTVTESALTAALKSASLRVTIDESEAASALSASSASNTLNAANRRKWMSAKLAASKLSRPGENPMKVCTDLMENVGGDTFGPNERLSTSAALTLISRATMGGTVLCLPDSERYLDAIQSNQTVAEVLKGETDGVTARLVQGAKNFLETGAPLPIATSTATVAHERQQATRATDTTTAAKKPVIRNNLMLAQ